MIKSWNQYNLLSHLFCCVNKHINTLTHRSEMSGSSGLVNDKKRQRGHTQLTQPTINHLTEGNFQLRANTYTYDRDDVEETLAKKVKMIKLDLDQQFNLETINRSDDQDIMIEKM